MPLFSLEVEAAHCVLPGGGLLLLSRDVEAAHGAKLTLDQLVAEGLGALPEIGDFSELQAGLDERTVREAIAALNFGPTALSVPTGRYSGRRG